MRRPVKYALVVLIAIAGVMPILWQSIAHGAGDPRDLRYQCWKLGLCRFDLDRAVQAVFYDTKRDELIIGKNESELRERFGYLVPGDQSTTYHRWATEFDEDPGEARLFIRKSDMMVTMKGGKAVRLSFVKGG